MEEETWYRFKYEKLDNPKILAKAMEILCKLLSFQVSEKGLKQFDLDDLQYFEKVNK